MLDIAHRHIAFRIACNLELVGRRVLSKDNSAAGITVLHHCRLVFNYDAIPVDLPTEAALRDRQHGCAIRNRTIKDEVMGIKGTDGVNICILGIDIECISRRRTGSFYAADEIGSREIRIAEVMIVLIAEVDRIVCHIAAARRSAAIDCADDRTTRDGDGVTVNVAIGALCPHNAAKYRRRSGRANRAVRDKHTVSADLARRCLCAINRPCHRRTIDLDTIFYCFTAARSIAAIGIDHRSTGQGNTVALHCTTTGRRTAIGILQYPTFDGDSILFHISCACCIAAIRSVSHFSAAYISDIALHIARTYRVAAIEIRDSSTVDLCSVSGILVQSTDCACIIRVRNCTAISVRQCPCYR